jgi:mannose-6-phosphate isomerase-like protein (cupin superfamily)
MKEKDEMFEKAEELLFDHKLEIESEDRSRPWGGFFVIKEKQAETFIRTFFPSLDPSDFSEFSKLSPKLLLVAPRKRLSWQYHHRRSEIWRVISGTVGVVVSNTNEQGPLKNLNEGESISLREGERHRLVGLEGWAILAEIWQHTDPDHPSDEDDIVRVEDDFGR